jgi:flagellar biosynthesis protein FliR
MLTFSGDWINQHVVLAMLMSVRILGVCMTMPLFAFKALNTQTRVVVSLLLAYFVQVSDPALVNTLGPDVGIATVVMEWGIGLFCGSIMRVGLMTMDLIAEVFSMQAGLSFAASINHDPALSSGLLGELLGMIALALAFALNVHLVFLDIMLQSFHQLPIGFWFQDLRLETILRMFGQSFALGVVITLPALVVYYLFNLTQAILARVSPQMNLFSVGFSIMVPLIFALLALLLPSLTELVTRSFEPAIALVRTLANGVR